MSAKPVNLTMPRRASGAFTLAELLVSIVVVVIIVLMGSQLMLSTTAITRTAHKYIDTDTQARVVFDRMALDFAQMVKRTDIDYYVKQRTGYNGHGNGHGWGNGRNGDKGSDQIAFFSHLPGYHPTTAYTVGQQSPISLVAYRVNEGNPSNNPAYGRLERIAKGLGWNGILNNPNSNSPSPIVFLPQTISAVTPWAAAVKNDNSNDSRDPDYEIIGPGVFRFEYYYLLKNGWVTDWPWDRRDGDMRDRQTIHCDQDCDPACNPTVPSKDPGCRIGLSQVEAIGVAIAVIDPTGRKLIEAVDPDRIIELAGDFPDFKSARGLGNQARMIGELERKWKSIVESTAQTGRTPSNKVVPPEAAKAIRIYTRYFDLKTL